MDIHGEVTFDAAAQRAMAALTEQDQLALFMPQGAVITRTDDRTFAFTVARDFGVTTIKLAGTMAVTTLEAGKSLRFLVEGRHVVGGSAVLDLAIRFDGDAHRCTLAYTGTVQAHGLVGKFLSIAEPKVQEQMKTAFADFGRRVARQQKALAQRQANA